MTLSNLNEFKSKFQTYGFSMANLYDVQIDVGGSSKLFEVLQGKFRLADGSAGLGQMMELMKLYTSEATLPGVNMSTSEYRITNTPQLKYAYGTVFNTFSMTFMLDSGSLIRQVFDVWTDTIYPYSRWARDNGTLRTKYKDDYVSDITILKYEKANSSLMNLNKLRFNALSKRMLTKEIIPGKIGGVTGFFKSVPVHAVKIINAFPSNISATSLGNESSSMTQLSIEFEYETIRPTGTRRKDDADGESALAPFSTEGLFA